MPSTASRLYRLDVERSRRRQILVTENELSGDRIACQLDEERCRGSAPRVQPVPRDFLLLQDRSDDPLLKSLHLHRFVASIREDPLPGGQLSSMRQHRLDRLDERDTGNALLSLGRAHEGTPRSTADMNP